VQRITSLSPPLHYTASANGILLLSLPLLLTEDEKRSETFLFSRFLEYLTRDHHVLKLICMPPLDETGFYNGNEIKCKYKLIFYAQSTINPSP